MTTRITPKPKRRFLRFTLSSLLLLMLVVCVGLGWKVDRVRKQREAVTWVQKLGGSVSYDYQTDDNFKALPNAEPPGPKWLMKLLGIDFFDDVVRVKLLQVTQVSDVTPLLGLTSVERLDLDGTQVSDVTPLAGLTSLKWLDLGGTPVSVSEKAVDNLKMALPQCEIVSGRTNR